MSSGEDTIVPATALSVSHHRQYGHRIQPEDLQRYLGERSRFTGLGGGVITSLDPSGKLKSCTFVNRCRNFSGTEEYSLEDLARTLNTGDMTSLPARLAGIALQHDQGHTNDSNWGLVSLQDIQAKTHLSLILQ